MKVVVMPGDGIGPEIMDEAVKVLDRLGAHGVKITWEHALVGGAAYEADGEPLPPRSLKLAQDCDAILFGSVGDDRYEHLGPKRPGVGLMRLRKELDLFANFRPVKMFDDLVGASTLRPEFVKGLDILIVRELTADLYYGQPRGREKDKNGKRFAFNTMPYHEDEVRRIAHVAFQAARTRSKKVCSVDKANVLEAMMLWREVVTEVGQEYPDVALTHMYVDAAGMALVRNPKQFDVMLTPNLFGDIMSDVAAMLSGSIGMLPSASVRADKKGLFEPCHGSAPDIARQDKANPIAQILSGAMMLRHAFAMEDAAKRVENAVRAALASGVRTADIMQPGMKLVGTRAMGDAVAAQI